MNSYIAALAQSLILYLILGLSYFGWGRVAGRVLRGKEQSIPSDITLIWLGWASTLLLFQVIHFFLPLTVYVVAPVFVIGIVFSHHQIANAFRLKPQKRSTVLIFAGCLFIMLVLAAWIASRSMISPDNYNTGLYNYDSGLYHFNAIRWINSFPIIPGLGNLQGRLAFNQSFFTYVAALNFYPYFGQGRSIANSFLFLLTFATSVNYLRPVFKQPKMLVKSHPFKFLPALFLLPTLGYLAFASDGLASPSPDLTSTLLQLIMFVILVRGIADWLNGQREQNYSAMLLTILAATSVTIKLSNLAYAAVIMAFVLAYTWQSSPRHTREITRILLPAFIVILVWCLRGYVLSGAPLYPSTIGYVPVAWAVPKEEMVNDANRIYSWARQPSTDWSIVLGSWDWFQPWLVRTATKNVMSIDYPFVVSVLFFVINVILFFLKKVKRPQFLEGSILIPVTFALIFWFFTAPDPRFANALFFLMALCMILEFLISIRTVVYRRALATILCAAFTLGNLHYALYAIQSIGVLKEISFSGYQAVAEVPLDKKVTQSGLIVYTPKNSDQCWDAPLPCTPYFNTSLMLREPGNLASGFVVKKSGEQ